MNIGLCIIVEGDEKLSTLKIAINSASSFVDEVYITTNGKKTDKIKKYCKDNHFHHSHLDWDDDFSKQRNFNFSQVDSKTDYILWLDSDDELIGGDYLRDLARLADKKELDTIFMTYWYGCRFEGKPISGNLEEVELYHQRERLIKVNRIKWVGRIHETPVEFKDSKLKYTNIIHTPDESHPLFEIAVLHREATRFDNDRNVNRTNRNRRILELQLKDEVEAKKVDPRTVLYLMKIYAEEDDEDTLNKCIRLGEEYLMGSGWDEERANCYILLAQCFAKLGSPEKAKQMLFGSMNEWPHNKGVYLKLADVCFALNKDKEMKFYMDIADNIETDRSTAGNRNILDDKYHTQLLKLKYSLNVSKNINKALEAAKEVYKMQPFEENEDQVDYITDLKLFNDASKNIDEFTKYLGEAKMYDELDLVLKVFPEKFKQLPFYNRLANKFSKPKVWGEKEICYYANFGGDHFEKWSPDNLKQGIGGSETAVIKLARLWVEKGYKVTVYGDPLKEGFYDGVNYLSYKRFNKKDKFNIFIQWRAGFMANKVSSKKFFIDLHDVWNEGDYLKYLEQIDAFFVKSNEQRKLATNIPDNKFITISNGI